ncbi:cation diffusion facilitator family transporter [Halalkalibacter nanhaiisediminis]|uniref:Cation diffusion facilitator family transporter n=1 Tax=Halalkalibacter nanhaiisediminis TaxID=688079 RepID=A0A562QGL3_9BACI|nr:cation diffusion facilitator family transporter [Halalkalibacter nanhaiisediminis]TWI55875.1 cation diffusion facilitator family transporter [Halalkalibacter nanhaiisediminis]
MDEQKYKNLKLGERGAIISIVAYLFLSALKLFVGYEANSEALRADGLNNATDIVASVAVLIGLKLSQRPPDHDHRYGHFKAESVASLVASFIMMGVGIHVLIEAITTIFSRGNEAPDMISAWTGVFSAGVMYFVYRYNRNLAKQINSQAVMAASKDNISDAWVSIGTAIGIFGAQLGLAWLDPLAAFLVGILICKTAWEIFREASHHLTDGFDEKELESYEESVLSIYGVEDVKVIRARNYGNNSVVDIVIGVNAKLDITDAHDISTKVEEILLHKHGVYDAHVHVEPN